MADLSNMRILTGSANQQLAHDIARQLGVPVAGMEIGRFADGEIRVKIQESVRGSDVFVIQPTCPPTSENLMELLIIMDGLKRASARRITAVMPYYGYARQEKKVKPREPITAKLVADLISVAGADRVITMDLHVQTIQGFFDLPVDHLYAGPLLAEYLKSLGLSGPEVVIVSPDVGGVGRAMAFADRLQTAVAVIAKRRPGPNVVERVGEAAVELIGQLDGKPAVLVDEMIDTGGTLISAAEVLIGRGAPEVYACATHGVFSRDAAQRLEASAIKEVVVTDTIPLPHEKRMPKITVLSVAPLLAEAIRRAHTDESVSTLFEKSWVEEKR